MSSTSQDQPFRRTKIVATLGPATDSAEAIDRLIAAGVNVFRLNFSHGDRETHSRTIRRIRAAAGKAGREIGILQDLGGPKIRLGVVPGGTRVLEPGTTVRLDTSSTPDPGALPVNYPHLAEDVEPGDPILLADGTVELRVEDVSGESVLCSVVTGGSVGSHKGVNLPGSHLRVPAFTDKDRLDLQTGLAQGVDFVALSFVRTEADLSPVAEILEGAKPKPLLIAKIEKPQAVERLEAILAAVDAVMVARGDLGVELPVEKVPMVQKRIIREAVRAGKPVITATQMLGSMVSSPRPTRAEASDVANAILDGTDAVMLSEETAVGSYPVEAVQTLHRLAVAVEPSIDHDRFLSLPSEQSPRRTDEAIGHAACWLAREVGARAIIASTVSGTTARLVARFRPAVPVFGLTPNHWAERQLTLSWGVFPAPVEDFQDTDSMFRLARRWIVERGLGTSGERIVLTAGAPINVPGTTNMLRVVDL